MKRGWMVLAVAALVAGTGVIAADPALARSKHRAQRHCVDRPTAFTWGGVITNRAPHANGCAPAVYEYGRYVGQDPDPFIRQQLRRDPQSGYSPL
jgi:hypothetical protein